MTPTPVMRLILVAILAAVAAYSYARAIVAASPASQTAVSRLDRQLQEIEQ